MATYNQIQRPDLLQRLTKRLGLNERAPISTLQPELQAVVLLEDLSIQSPFIQPTGRRASSGLQAAAVAGQYSQVELGNAAGTGIVAVVHRIIVDLMNAGNVDIHWGFRDPLFGTDLASTATRAWTDQRLGGVPTCVVRYGADASNQVNPRLGSIIKLDTEPALFIDLPDIVVDPGRVFRVSLNAVNIGLAATVEWQEFVE